MINIWKSKEIEKVTYKIIRNDLFGSEIRAQEGFDGEGTQEKP